MGSARPRLSLRAYAVSLLARREHSVAELRTKLRRRLEASADPSGPAECPESLGPPEPAEPPRSPGAGAAADSPPDDGVDAIEAVIVWLQHHGYLDEARFVESRVHDRSARHGERRIRQELAQHGLALDATSAQALRETEAARAAALLQRRFPSPPVDERERARRYRFLLGRGFAPEVVARLVSRDGQRESGGADPSPE